MPFNYICISLSLFVYYCISIGITPCIEMAILNKVVVIFVVLNTCCQETVKKTLRERR